MTDMFFVYGRYREMIMIDGCVPKQQHYRSPPHRVQTQVVVVTDDSTETGSDGAGGTARTGRWGAEGAHTVEA